MSLEADTDRAAACAAHSPRPCRNHAFMRGVNERDRSINAVRGTFLRFFCVVMVVALGVRCPNPQSGFWHLVTAATCRLTIGNALAKCLNTMVDACLHTAFQRLCRTLAMPRLEHLGLPLELR